MNRRLTACCAAIVLLATACADSVRGTAAGAAPQQWPAGSGPVSGPVSGPASGESTLPNPPASPQSVAPPEPPEVPSSEPVVSSQPSEPAEPSEPVDWELPDPEQDPAVNSYGDIAAEPGKTYAVTLSSEQDAGPGLVFRVRKLVVDPTCDAKADPPRNGHFLLIDLQVEAHRPTEADLDNWHASFGSYDWTVFDTDGSAQTGVKSDQADTCRPDQELPYLSADELQHTDGIVSGVVVLDVREPNGAVLLDVNTDQKWEFGYPG